MKKHNSDSMFSKYSGTPVRKSKANREMPLMTTYEQRYKATSSMSKDVTEPKAVQTLEEKIESRNKISETRVSPLEGRVSVEIAGHTYLLGANEKMSESRIRRVASLVNKILTETKDNNPGLTNSKITTLALLDACDQLVAKQDEVSNMKTELMYLQQKIKVDDVHKAPKEPTPMELLADEESLNEEN